MKTRRKLENFKRIQEILYLNSLDVIHEEFGDCCSMINANQGLTPEETYGCADAVHPMIQPGNDLTAWSFATVTGCTSYLFIIK